jgi:fluoride exporter
MTAEGVAWGWAVLAVAAGGAVGSVVRHLLTRAPGGARRGVLVANTVGSALLGAVVALVESPVVLLLLGTGLCGALTTWSTLAVQAEELGRHAPGRAVAYVATTMVLGLSAALITLMLLG